MGKEGTLKEFKRRNRVSFLTPCVNAMGRRPYCPSSMEVSYCTCGFGAICAHFHYRVIQHTCMRDLSPWGKGNSRLIKLLAGLTTKKSRGTITHLHTWQQDDCHSRFPPLNFLGNTTPKQPSMLLASLSLALYHKAMKTYFCCVR